MTYDLKSYYITKGFSIEEAAEFDSEETVEAIENILINAGHQVDKIGCLEQLMNRLLAGDRWDLVFNFAEGVYGIGREAQIPALLDAFQIPYTFSSTEILATALHKGLTNAVMRTYGVRTADFQIVRNLKDINKIKIPFPLFVKPISEGTSKGISRNSHIDTKEQLIQQCEFILKTFHQPALVEAYLPGREFTVGLIGTYDNAKVLGVMEVKPTTDADKYAYTFDNKQFYENRIIYKAVDEPKVAALALKAWQSLHCRDAGRVDIRMNIKGEPCFMEVNPLAGLNPVYSDLCILCQQIGFPYEKLILFIVNEAYERSKRMPDKKSYRPVTVEVFEN